MENCKENHYVKGMMPDMSFLVFAQMCHLHQNFKTYMIMYGDFMVIVEPWYVYNY